MLTFNYTAKDTASNKVVKSTVKADSEKVAAKLLMAQGLTPLEITEQSQSGNIFSKLSNKVPVKSRIVFSRQLSTLINAGLPLTQSLHTVREQTEHKRLQAIIQDIITAVEGGTTLSTAFSKHPDVFDDVYLALVSAGEVSGTLDKALERIADQQEKDAETMGKIKGAMVYPLIVSLVMVGVIVFMLVTVVPQIQKLYKDLHQELPIATAIMVSAANFIISYWWIVLIVVGILVYFVINWSKTTSGRKTVDGIKLNMPLFGPMFQKLYMARFARTTETLMATGVQMLETLKISARAVNNVHIAEAINRAADKVKDGKALSVSLKSEHYVLSLVPQMVNIGEQSGGIDAMLSKVATFYENELDRAIKAISTMIEPILMVMLAGVAGLMIGAVLFPIYSLVGSGAATKR